MKKVLLMAAVLLMPLLSRAETVPLSKSPRNSEYISVYKLDHKQLRELFGNDPQPIDAGYLSSYQTKYKSGESTPELPRGNYVLVQAVNGKLSYTSHVVDDIEYKVLPGDKLVVALYDAEGRNVSDASVRMLGKGKMRYDKRTHTYTASLPDDATIVEIENKGVYRYLTVNDRGDYRDSYDYNYGHKSAGQRKAEREDKRIEDKMLSGMMVFSKPKYKPGETVKFKAYITDKDKKPFEAPLQVRLVSASYYGANRIDTLLTELRPYAKGGYEYEFKLSDSLGVKLDSRYNIRFVDKADGERSVDITNGFQYEDYELKGVTFNARMGSSTYYKGEEVAVYMKASDMNGMAQLDGRVELSMSREGWGITLSGNSALVNRSAWIHKMPLDKSGEQKLIIPDSVFAEGVSARYFLSCAWYSADNEKHYSNLYFYRNATGDRLVCKDTPNAVTIAQLDGVDTVSTTATVTYYTNNGKVAGTEEISLPGSVSPGKMISYMMVKSDKSSTTYYLSNYHSMYNNVALYSGEGSVNFEVNNPRGYAFVYRLWRGDRLIERGYTTDKVLKISKSDNARNMYTAQVDMLTAAGYLTTTRTVNNTRRDLKLEVETPTTIYPGQTVDVDMTVTDWKGRGVRNADLTAYAYTSKFRNNPIVMPYWRQEDRKTVNVTYPDEYRSDMLNVVGKLEWDRWKDELKLTDNEFYEFLHSQYVGLFDENTVDSTTQIAPYVIVDGAIQGTQVVWLNDIPCYFRGADKMQPYSFKVDPDKKYTIRVRTHDRMVEFSGFSPMKGKMNVLSFNGDRLGKPTTSLVAIDTAYREQFGHTRFIVWDSGVKKDSLSTAEHNLLRGSLVSLHRNFGGRYIADGRSRTGFYKQTHIERGGVVYYLPAMAEPRRYYRSYESNDGGGNLLFGAFSLNGALTGLYVDGALEGHYKLQGGNEYRLAADGVEVRPIDEAMFSKRLTRYTIDNPDFTQRAMTAAKADSLYLSELMKHLCEARDWSYIAPMRGVKDARELKRYDVKLITGNWITKSGQSQTPAFVKISSLDEDAPQFTMWSSHRNSDYYKVYGTEAEGRYRITLYFADWTYIPLEVTLHASADAVNYVQFTGRERTEDAAGKVISNELNYLKDNMFYNIQAPELGVKVQQRPVQLEKVGCVEKANLEKKVITGLVINIYDCGFRVNPPIMVEFNGQFKTLWPENSFKFAYDDDSEGDIVFSVEGTVIATLPFEPGFNYVVKSKHSEFNPNIYYSNDMINPFVRDYYWLVDAYTWDPDMYPDQTEDDVREEYSSRGTIIRGKVVDEAGKPVMGASVVLKSNNAISASATVNGTYTLKVPSMNSSLVVTALGKAPMVVKLKEGQTVYIITLGEAQAIEKVKIVSSGIFMRDKVSFTGSAQTYAGEELNGYWLQSVKSLDPSMLVEDESMEMVADMSNESAGGGSLNLEAATAQLEEGADKALIILNGLPYSGTMADVDMTQVVSLSVIKPPKSVDMYGQQGAFGVIVITTRDTSDEEGAGQSLRTNFRDDAFWQPKLITDKEGKASFKVTYPDDITSWDAHFVAVGKGYDFARKELNIRSFKALNAQLALPRFAVEGDRFDAVGKISNYLGDTLTVKREAAIDGRVAMTDELRVAESYNDKVSVTAGTADSLAVKYTVQSGGIFDGEERKVPIYRQGTMQTDGVFLVLNADSTYNFGFDGGKGDVTVNIEASSLEMFLREIAAVEEYGYLCNEQMASKIKALLLKRRMSKMFGLDYNEDKKIVELVTKLNKNVNSDGLWGWWGNGGTELWISQQVVEAMLMAERDGVQTTLDRSNLMWYMSNAALREQPSLGRKTATETLQQYCRKLMLIKELDYDYDIAPFVDKLNDVRPATVYDKVLIMRTRQLAGEEVRLDSLMKWSQTTMLGGLHWGERRRMGIQPLYRYVPYSGDVQATLLAYRILRDMGGHGADMERIRNYFFELRRDGNWKNIYESANIMEAIMPDMLREGETYSEAGAVVNGVAADKFPYKVVLNDTDKVAVRKTGTAPVFFTAYQQSWNPEPKAENKGFTVTTSFDNGVTLTAGEAVVLEVVVTTESDADYVMIEVPIPAGCSYDSKVQNWWAREVHREHYKDRVSIFCGYMPKGETKFRISLLPRYTGEYHMNPAKAELMYFPTFYGREDMKQVNIKEAAAAK